MTVDVYDLGTARSAWTHTADAFDGGPRNPSEDEIYGMHKVQLPDSTGGPVGVAGQVLTAPPLGKVIADCLYTILRNLDSSDNPSMRDYYSE